MCGPTFIFDVSCFKHLRSDDARQGLLDQVAFRHGQTVGTTINAIEVARNRNDRTRRELRDILQFLSGRRPLLPWPDRVLEQVGYAVIGGKVEFEFELSGFENLLFEDPTAEQQDEADRLVEGLEEPNLEMHASARPEVQRFVRERGLRGAWSGRENSSIKCG